MEIFHNPVDTKTLIPFLEKTKSQNIEIKKEKRLSQINDKNHQFATAPFLGNNNLYTLVLVLMFNHLLDSH